MSNFLGERYDIKEAVWGCTATAGVYSQPFSLADTKRVTVLCGYDAVYSSILGTAINPAQFTIMAGTHATVVSAMTSLTSVSLTLGQATIGTLPKMQEVMICAQGTVASGQTIQFDSVTFTLAANSCVGDKNILCSACSVLINTLVSAIATHCTHLETYGKVTAGNATATAYVFVRVKDIGPAAPQSFNCVISANASSTDLMWAQPIKAVGVIEFTPGDVLATNSSYTHFGIRINSTSTVFFSAHAMVIREVGYNPLSTRVSRKEGA